MQSPLFGLFKYMILFHQLFFRQINVKNCQFILFQSLNFGVNMSEEKCKLNQPLEDNTINLAKDGNSYFDRKKRLLVYQKKYDPSPFCGAQLPIGITSTPKSAKKIRVCTVQDIKSACPDTCVKPKIRDPLSIWGLTKKCISLGVRTAIVGSVVYWTWYIGLWGDATETEKLYVSMKNSVLQKEDSIEDHAPALDRNLHAGREKWNFVVNKSFLLIDTTSNKISTIIQKYTKSCEAKPDSK